jgi:glucose/arabinose dehydrogenase
MNLLRRGANYGWPEAQGEDHDGFAAPLAVYNPAIAPSGATFVSKPGSAWSGDFMVGCLIGEQDRRLRFDGSRVTPERGPVRRRLPADPHGGGGP